MICRGPKQHAIHRVTRGKGICEQRNGVSEGRVGGHTVKAGHCKSVEELEQGNTENTGPDGTIRSYLGLKSD